MTNLMSREIRLASRPSGLPTAADFTLACTELKPLQDEQVLVRNLFPEVHRFMPLVRRASGLAHHVLAGDPRVRVSRAAQIQLRRVIPAFRQAFALEHLAGRHALRSRFTGRLPSVIYRV